MKSDSTEYVMAGFLHVCHNGCMIRIKKGPKEHHETIPMPDDMAEAINRKEVFVEFTVRMPKLDKEKT